MGTRGRYLITLQGIAEIEVPEEEKGMRQLPNEGDHLLIRDRGARE